MSVGNQHYPAPEMKINPLPTPEDNGFFDQAEQASFIKGLAAGIRAAHVFADTEVKGDPTPAHIALSYEENRLKDREAYESIRRDPLTGLYTRGRLIGAYENLQNTELSTHKRSPENASNEPVSLLIVDLDHFKAVNDTYGHLTGDRTLKAAAQAILESIRKTDTAVRYGGEEFAVILPRASETSALSRADIIREAISKITVTDNDGTPLAAPTASIGVAEADLRQPLEANIEHADQALYEAKNAGRNRSVGYSQLVRQEV